MRLRVLLPSRVHLDAAVAKVAAEAENGSFGLLPNHVDFVTRLRPGLLAFVRSGEDAGGSGEEQYLGVDEGVLVKHGDTVLVSVRDATDVGALGQVRRAAEERFAAREEQRRRVRSSIARIEAGFVRKFMDTQRHG